MVRIKQHLLFILVLLAPFSWADSSGNILLSEDFNSLTLSKHTNNLFLNAGINTTPSEVLNTFLTTKQNNSLPGLSKHQIWRLYTINNSYEAGTVKDIWLTKSNSFINQFDVYLLDDQSDILSTDFLGADSQSLYLKPANLRQSTKLSVQGGQSYYLLIKQFSTSPQAIEITLHSNNEHRQYLTDRKVMNSIIATILGALFVFNIVLFAGYPDRAYFWFLLFHFVLISYFSILYGFGHSFWPNTMMQLASSNIMVMNYLLLFLLFQFATHFLNSFKNEDWRIWKFSHVRVQAAIFFCLSITSVIDEAVSLVIFFTLLSLMLLLIATRCIKYYRKGFKPAQFLLISIIIQQIGASIGTSSFLYLLPENFLTRHAFFESSIAELLIIAYAIAARTRYLEKERLRSGERDSLTGIPNQSYVEHNLSEHWPKLLARQSQINIVGFKLVGLKEIAQNLGPSEADRFSKRLIQYLNNNLAKQQGIVRLPKTSHFIAVQSANQYFILSTSDHSASLTALETLIKEGLIMTKVPLTITSHFGCYSCIDSNEPLNESLRKFVVALAMAESEASRKATYQVAMDEKFKLAGMIKRELNESIQSKQLECWVQPQINLETGLFRGGEILVRWRHPERGLIPPAVFIPLVEQLNMVIDVTRFIMGETFQWLAEHRELNLELSINLSSKDLLIPGFCDEVAELKQRFDIGNNRLCMEITETVLMDRPEESLETIQQLKSMGYNIAMDDFGTGYSSLSYLSRIRPDEIKIDQEFVKTMNESKINLNIIKSIIQLSENMNATCVAEGVETEQVLAEVKKLGCHFGQGYLWAKPMPIIEFSEWLIMADNS